MLLFGSTSLIASWQCYVVRNFLKRQDKVRSARFFAILKMLQSASYLAY